MQEVGVPDVAVCSVLDWTLNSVTIETKYCLRACVHGLVTQQSFFQRSVLRELTWA